MNHCSIGTVGSITVAQLHGSSNLVALPPSVPSLLPMTLLAQSGSGLQLLPLHRGCRGEQSQLTTILIFWVIPLPLAIDKNSRNIAINRRRDGGQGSGRRVR